MFASKKPYSAVTVQVDSLTSERYPEDDLSGIPDLTEVIGLQATGPTEFARAIRKKLKYGNARQQLRALVILDSIIENGGTKLQSRVWDELLLERLRICASSSLYDPRVQAKCKMLFASWRKNYANTPGMSDLANLYKMLPRKPKESTSKPSKALQESERDPFEDDEDERESTEQQVASSSNALSQPSNRKQHKSRGSSGLSSSFFGTSEKVSSKDGKKKRGKRAFDLNAEREAMSKHIASSYIEAGKLMNILRLHNREEGLISQNSEAQKQFEVCKRLRRYIVRYVLNVARDDLIGDLLGANDALIAALVTFEQLDRAIDADSDSDDELAEQQHAYRMMEERNKQQGDTAASTTNDLAGLDIIPTAPPVAPPRPPQSTKVTEVQTEDDAQDDDEDPFGDSNAVDTPVLEKEEPKWRSV